MVGNFGGTNRMQYTAMGDAMNIAPRLEGANKYLGTAILGSEAVRAAAPGHAWRMLGRVAVSGVAEGIVLHEPLPPAQAGDAATWNAAIHTFASGKGAQDWETLLAAHGAETAATALEARRGLIEEGTTYELPSK